MKISIHYRFFVTNENEQIKRPIAAFNNNKSLLLKQNDITHETSVWR